jgi:hypothetical protein
MVMPAQIRPSNFQPGGNQLLGLFVYWDAGSNLRKQISAGGQSVIGTFRKRDTGSNLRKQFWAGGNQLLWLFVNGDYFIHFIVFYFSFFLSFYFLFFSNVQNSGKNGGADSTLVERFSTLDSQLLGIFVNWDTGSNPLKQFSARASYLLGFFISRGWWVVRTFRKLGCRLKYA